MCALPISCARSTEDLKVRLDMSLSTARKPGGENNLFTTIRRKNSDHSFDRRPGSPIHDYGPASPAYYNAATNQQGLTALYYRWGGGPPTTDENDGYAGAVGLNPGATAPTAHAG